MVTAKSTNPMMRATIAVICLTALFTGSASALQGTPEPTPTEASAVVPSLPEEGEEIRVDEEDPLDDWQLVGSILVGGFVIAIGSFLWVRSSRGPISRK